MVQHCFVSGLGGQYYYLGAYQSGDSFSGYRWPTEKFCRNRSFKSDDRDLWSSLSIPGFVFWVCQVTAPETILQLARRF
jgi:hypothetical protein